MNTRTALTQLNQAIPALAKTIPKIPSTLQRLQDQTDNGLHAASTDTEGQTSGHSDPTARTQLTPNEHAELAKALANLLHIANQIIDTVANNDPDRVINQCGTCGEALESRAAILCTSCVNDQAEQAVEQAKRHCGNTHCAKPMDKNEPLRNNRCNACDCHHRKHGTERMPVEALALNDQVPTK